MDFAHYMKVNNMKFYISAIIGIILFCLYDYIKDRHLEKHNQKLKKEYFKNRGNIDE